MWFLGKFLFKQGGFLMKRWFFICSVLSVSFVFLALAWLLGDIWFQGWSGLSFEFIFDSPSMSGRKGGIWPILVSTFMILAVCIITVIPLAFGSALFLSEWVPKDKLWGRFIQQSLDVLSGMPSIVFGLFGHALFSQVFGWGVSILSGGLTLSCMVLPFVVGTTQLGFESLPKELRKNGAALGLPKTTISFKILFPLAIPSLVTGLTLGITRALSETAALLFTAGYVDRMPESFMDSGRALSIHIYELAMNVPGGNQNAYSSALVLILALILISLTTKGLGKWLVKKTHSLEQSI